jgi:hypothetical protein
MKGTSPRRCLHSFGYGLRDHMTIFHILLHCFRIYHCDYDYDYDYVNQVNDTRSTRAQSTAPGGGGGETVSVCF